MKKPSSTFENITHRVVIVGGGFGGLSAAKALRREPVHVTLIDRRNFHLFQPLLYQVATGGLSPANIAAPLRALLKRQSNAEVLLGEVVGIDVGRKRVLLADGEVEFDSLIVATGVRHHYFGNPQWEEHAPGLKTVEDATNIRRRALLAFEAAERDAAEHEKAEREKSEHEKSEREATEDSERTNPRQTEREAKARLQRLLTFVVVGAGPTGVELSGALAELSRHTLRRNFRRIDPAQARILLVEAADRVLPAYPEPLSGKAQKQLERLGVEVRTGTRVTQIEADSVMLLDQQEAELIETRAVFWAAGVQASRMGALLAEAAGAELDRVGRVKVEADCSLPGHPNIFVIGDLAHFDHGGDGPLPGLAPVAMQQGRYVARLIWQRLEGKTTGTFRYHNHGMMATIGRAAAVAVIGGLRFTGFAAWLLWLLVHLMSLVGFENRMLVFMQWAWDYFTRNRTARLITGELALPRTAEKPPQAQARETPLR